MKQLQILLISLTVNLVIYNPTLAANTNAKTYIVDQLPMVFRTGPTKEYRMQSGLMTGDPVTILAVDETNQTTQVQTLSGKTGWVESKYIVSIEGAKSQLERLQKIYQIQKKKLTGQLQQQKDLQQQYDQIFKRNEQLQHQVTELENNLQIEQQKSLRLSDKKRFDIFYAGGIVALISILLGWILARRRPKGSGWH